MNTSAQLIAYHNHRLRRKEFHTQNDKRSGKKNVFKGVHLFIRKRREIIVVYDRLKVLRRESRELSW